MENIDDECDQNDIAFVKIDDQKEAQEYGVTSLPQLIFFEKRIPHVYEGIPSFSYTRNVSELYTRRPPFDFRSDRDKLNARVKFLVHIGDLLKEEELLSWLIHQKRHSEIPEVTNKMVDKLVETVPYLAVLFCT